MHWSDDWHKRDRSQSATSQDALGALANARLQINERPLSGEASYSANDGNWGALLTDRFGTTHRQLSSEADDHGAEPSDRQWSRTAGRSMSIKDSYLFRCPHPVPSQWPFKRSAPRRCGHRFLPHHGIQGVLRPFDCLDLPGHDRRAERRQCAYRSHMPCASHGELLRPFHLFPRERVQLR